MLVRARKLTVESAAAAPDWQAIRPAGDPAAASTPRSGGPATGPRTRSG
jgi:hypothetical protein